MDRMIEAYMMVGHHTLVVMSRGERYDYRVTCYSVTPQCNGTDVEKLLADRTFTAMRYEAYASTDLGALSLFQSVVSTQLREEMECQEQLVAQAA
jgi:hypothetical protein